MTRNQPKRVTDEATMDDMPTPPAHAKPGRRDHLWVLVLIAACCLVKVWPSWIGIGAEAGFPEIGRIPTDWTLAVIIEAYWGYAVYAWLAASEGLRSKRYAMWSAIAVFILSLVGQSAAQVISATAVKVFANALPVTVLAIIAILVHLRQKDREDTARAERRDLAAEETAALRAELETLAAEVEPLREALTAALADAKQSAEKADTLGAKLAAATARKRRPATARKSGSATARKSGAATGSATAQEKAEAPVDLDSEAKVLWYLDKGYSASKAGTLAGLTDSRGRQIARLKKVPPTDTVDAGSERSDEHS